MMKVIVGKNMPMCLNETKKLAKKFSKASEPLERPLLVGAFDELAVVGAVDCWACDGSPFCEEDDVFCAGCWSDGFATDEFPPSIDTKKNLNIAEKKTSVL